MKLRHQPPCPSLARPHVHSPSIPSVLPGNIFFRLAPLSPWSLTQVNYLVNFNAISHHLLPIQNWRKLDGVASLCRSSTFPTLVVFPLWWDQIYTACNSLWLLAAALGLFLLYPCRYSLCTQYFAKLNDSLLGHGVPSIFKAFIQTALSPLFQLSSQHRQAT